MSSERDLFDEHVIIKEKEYRNKMSDNDIQIINTSQKR
jgi:hypothetical protein